MTQAAIRRYKNKKMGKAVLRLVAIAFGVEGRKYIEVKVRRVKRFYRL